MNFLLAKIELVLLSSMVVVQFTIIADCSLHDWFAFISGMLSGPLQQLQEATNNVSCRNDTY